MRYFGGYSLSSYMHLETPVKVETVVKVIQNEFFIEKSVG